jgi:hypothetical protein
MDHPSELPQLFLQVKLFKHGPYQKFHTVLSILGGKAATGAGTSSESALDLIATADEGID